MATQKVTHTFCIAVNDILLYTDRLHHVLAKLSTMTWKKLLSLPDQN